jgi:peptide deformylase
MSVLKIIKYGDPILRGQSLKIDKVDDEVKRLIRDMLDTMYKTEGIGLAACQVGIPKRIIVIDTSKGEDKKHAIVLINPEILFKKGEEISEEGCLSFLPKIRAEVKRATEITIKALNLDEKEIKIAAKDILARVVQHEIDHLNGVLIIDHMSFLKRLSFSKELKELKKQSPQVT